MRASPGVAMMCGDARSYMPAPIVCLRTCKSEVLLGVPREVRDAVEREDAKWDVSSKWAVVQSTL